MAEGRNATGYKLLTEAALATRFGVNRHTVRHGISVLVEEGPVRNRLGAGAFVAATPTDYPIGKRVRFHENLIVAGRRPEKRMLALDERAATIGEAQALQIAAGEPVCTYHGLSLADGQPIAVFENLFPILRLPEITAALSKTSSITEALSIASIDDYTQTSTRLTAVRATATHALLLDVGEGDPLLRSSSVNTCGIGMPIEYGRTWFAGDRVTLTLGT